MKVFVLKKKRDLNFHVFDTRAQINESKALTKHISCRCKSKIEYRIYNLSQKWHNYKCWCQFKIPKSHNVFEKDYTWNPATCICENGNI